MDKAFTCPVPDAILPMRQHGDLMLMCMNIAAEALNEPWEGKLGVGWVVMNRIEDKRWPKTASEVILQPKQFSWLMFEKDRERVLRPRENISENKWNECFRAAYSALFEIEMDPTRGANHYHADYIAKPNWAKPDKITTQIGRHIFYRL